jgi:hypothetical protein
MARIPRVGVVHHVISRFVDRSWQMVDEVERAEYLARLAQALKRSDWVLLAYALMSNHVHLVLEAGAAPLWGWTKSTHSGMAHWLNARHERLGPVFAGRPYAEAVEAARVPFVVAYVHNNPVRAQLVDWAGDSSWTSHAAYLSAMPAPAPLAVERGLSLCGYPTGTKGRRAFDEWVRGCSKQPRPDSSAEVELAATLSCARRTLGATVMVGTPTVQASGRCIPVLAPASATLSTVLANVSTEAVIAAVKSTVGIDPRGSRGRDLRPAISEARRLALVVWLRTGHSRVQMSRALGIGESTASDLLNRRPERARGPEGLAEHILKRLCG